jgi:HAD superfamily hydrolase (TIGR01549 family)
LVDPEDFRPKEFRRAEIVALLLELDKPKFIEYWETTSKSRLITPRREIEYVKDFVAESGGSVSNSSLDEAESALGRYQDLALLNPRREVLKSLKLVKARGYKLGLLSNTHERDTREWPRSPLAPLFEAVAFSYEIGVVKPDARAYQHILGRLGAEASKCVFVGDGANEELAGAKNANFKSVVFMKRFVSRNGLRSAERLEAIARQADHTVDSFEELSGLEL